MPGKRVQFDDETWAAVDLLARDREATFQELADEAFRDLLNKHGRFAAFRAALKASAKHSDAHLDDEARPQSRPRSQVKRRNRVA